jgi:Rrf2 family protein
MVLSNACNYGLRAAFYLASRKNRKYVPISEIARELDIPFHFLTKVLQILTQAGILISFKGPNGGVGLARQASQITLKDIILAIDGPALFEQCLLGLDQCSDENPCPLHERWSQLRAELDRLFSQSTLESVAHNLLTSNLRIVNLSVLNGHEKQN